MAGGVHFGGRLGERKIAGPQARLCFGAEKFAREIIHGAFEIAEGDVRIHGQAFDLVEHVAVRRVGIIAAIDFARDDDAHRRLLLFHGANLHRRSVRAQQMPAARARDVEGVHVVARGMMLGNIQRLEIVVRRFDFGSGDDAEADRGENAQKFVVGLADQVARADGALDAGKRKVNFVASRSAVCSAVAVFSAAERGDSIPSMCDFSALRLWPTAGFTPLDAGFSQFSVISEIIPDLAAQPL